MGAIPGYLKAKTGAHEVINTIMLNYVAFRLVELLISGPLRDTFASAVQTFRISPAAELWSLFAVPARMADPLNALGVTLCARFLAWSAMKWWVTDSWLRSKGLESRLPAFMRGRLALVVAILVGLLAFVLLPILTRILWPFQDEYDRLHIGILFSVVAAVAVWRLLGNTKIGFELRAVGANPNAARYAGTNITARHRAGDGDFGRAGRHGGHDRGAGRLDLPLSPALLLQRLRLRFDRHHLVGEEQPVRHPCFSLSVGARCATART